MDDIVKQAMAKWPNVPHCYGWLALDARGAWRMRDDRTQALNLPGDRIVNAALLGFINRNYTHDDRGRWFFQNGPQRVYVDLEATPYIARTDPTQGFLLQTNEALSMEAAWMTDGGRLLLQGSGRIAQVDDRDVAQCLVDLRMNGQTIGDEELLAWIAAPAMGMDIVLLRQGKEVPVRRIEAGSIPRQFGFDPRPRADAP
jgi:hypothetical protein